MMRIVRLGAAALAVLGAVVVAAAAPAPVKPWVAVGDIGCNWEISSPDGKTHRASIGTGDDDPVFSIDDAAFVPFPEYGRINVTLRFDGNARRTATASAWTGIVIGGERSLGMFLDAPARRAMGAARRIEVIHQGKVLLDLPLARTPTRAQLEKCTFPKGRKGDSE